MTTLTTPIAQRLSGHDLPRMSSDPAVSNPQFSSPAVPNPHFDDDFAAKWHLSLNRPRSFRHRCVVCGKGIRDADRLLSHMAAKHNMNKLFRCELCGRAFGCRGVLSRHIRSMHAFQALT